MKVAAEGMRLFCGADGGDHPPCPHRALVSAHRSAPPPAEGGKAARRQANGDVEREPYILRPRCATIELGGGCSGLVRPAPA